MEEKIKKMDEVQIVEYLKVLSDSTESNGQVKELSKEFLGAPDGKHGMDRHWPRIAVNNLQIDEDLIVEPGSHEHMNRQPWLPNGYERGFLISPVSDGFRPSQAKWDSGLNL